MARIGEEVNGEAKGATGLKEKRRRWLGNGEGPTHLGRYRIMEIVPNT